MIIAEQKPLEEIQSYIEPYKRIGIIGCKGCVTVCSTGGAKEVAVLSGVLELARQAKGKPIEIKQITLERQCDTEFLDQLVPHMDGLEALVSVACGVGVQFLAERYGSIPVFPGVNTTFMGGAEKPGQWVERCQGCGACKLALTAGICPISRCSKSLLNGPCGGSQDGRCEIDPSVPCGWQLIIDRLDAMGRLGDYEKIIEINDWRTSRHGGPRKMVREDMQ